MSSRWISPINWNKFPDEVKQRCKTIADEVEKLGWPPEVIEEKNGIKFFWGKIYPCPRIKYSSVETW